MSNTPYLGLYVRNPLATEKPAASGEANEWDTDLNFQIIDGAFSALAGGPSLTVVFKSASFTAQVGKFNLVTTSGGTVTVMLPSPAIAGQIVVVKIIDIGTVNIVPTSGEIDGLSSFELTAQWQYVYLVADGTNWQIISRN